MAEKVFPWLESLPLAPEYHPTLSEFIDPVSYIMKIEPEASKFGICKIITPLYSSPKETIIANLNKSLSYRNRNSRPTFTTRKQQIGVSPLKQHRLLERSVRDPNASYTLAKFEAKAKAFENDYMKRGSNAERGLTALEVETLYWKAQLGKPLRDTVEYGTDVVGSAFHQTGDGHGNGGVMRVMGDSKWNMRVVARSDGSLFKFLKEEIEGVTLPMVYISMLFSWFAWHVEDHEFHSLNYMHMGAAKTWYGVPMDAAVAFEDVVREHGYGGDLTPRATYSRLAGKSIVMSPEVLVKVGVPCYRLMQNAGELVVTFPRAYHSGFSHGFNCGEAINIATPDWLKVAREAAIRRAAIDYFPLICHSQLLCDLALSLSSSLSTSMSHEHQSSQLTDSLKTKRDNLVKRHFVEDMAKNNKLLRVLSKDSPIIPITKEALEEYIDDMDLMETPYSSFDNLSSFSQEYDEKPNSASMFVCVACGFLCYHCVAIIQPTKEAARHLMLANYRGITNAANDYSMTASCSKAKAITLVRKWPENRIRVEDLRKTHIFCLEHAVEVEERFRSIGEVRMLLLCHQDYSNIEAQTGLIANELQTDYEESDLVYMEARNAEKDMIRAALDTDEANDCNRDWTVVLGYNLYCSAKS